ncbi:MAG: hypothetical protein ABSE58_03720 [Candidatus Limnocylindrales bacterium]|jgi:hypothetical protein
MTLDRRLDKIDEALSPTQLVLRWLAEAHSYGDLVPYVNSLLAGDPPVAPLDRLAREAVHGARTAMRGKRPEMVDAAVRSALRETVFRYELVLRINVVAHELLDQEELIAALFASQLAMLLGETPDKGVGGDSHLRRLELCRRLTLLRVNELLASREARSSVEARYLGGHSTLFPDVAAAFEAQLRTSQEIAISAWRAAEIDGVDPPPPEDPDTVEVRAGELVADLVEPARSETLDKLGEGRQALDIAAGWVRNKLAYTSGPLTSPSTLASVKERRP